MQRPRTPINLSESLHRQLNSYAVAASAAGVSLLALAQPSEAKIVYTPAHVRIFGPEQHAIFDLDLTRDKQTDFVVQNTSGSSANDGWSQDALYVKGAGSNGIECATARHWR